MGVCRAGAVIACVNLANLLLAQAAKRRKELSIRAAMGRGAPAWSAAFDRKHRAFAARRIGWTAGSLRGRKSCGPSASVSLDGSIDLSFDARVVGFTVAISLLTGLVFGIIRPSRPPHGHERDFESRRTWGALGLDAHRLRGLLVIAEIALALVALVDRGSSFAACRTPRQYNGLRVAESVSKCFLTWAPCVYDADHGQQSSAMSSSAQVGSRSGGCLRVVERRAGGGILATIFREGEQADPNNAELLWGLTM